MLLVKVNLLILTFENKKQNNNILNKNVIFFFVFCLGSSKKRAKHKAALCMIEQCYVKLKLTDSPLVKTIEQYL